MGTATIQPCSKDAILLSSDPTTNYGTTEYIISGYLSGNQYISIVEFTVDWDVDVPTGAIIDSAKLGVYVYYNHTATSDHRASRLLRTDWNETECTWNIYKATNNWGTAGAKNTSTDYTTTDEATVTVDTDDGWIDYTVTDQVKTAQSSDINPIFRLNQENEAGTSDNYAVFRSSEYAADETKWPRLVIDYHMDTSVSSSVSVGCLVSASRQLDIIRSAPVQIGVLASATRVFARSVASSVAIGVAVSATRVHNAVKTATVAIGVLVTVSIVRNLPYRVKVIARNFLSLILGAKKQNTLNLTPRNQNSLILEPRNQQTLQLEAQNYHTLIIEAR